ncbi:MULTISPECIES: CHASE domain-containing protein [Thalassospira]|uniref:histidine kinase n=2 Tax=Thalassospira TaxID=168934 RepID=A0A367W8V0_9PROT|nr:MULTISPECIES: CHASE domain-containing protein [Thalassospira]MDG4718104.1 CHASE domain-containing protein [Thalassospira sp. FZY0004]RCK37874.1 histidine kinase [Thalassospira profundimaris]
MERQRQYILRALVIALGYFLTGYAGLQLPFYGSSVTLVWAPSGIAIATLIVWGWHYFPAVFIGALAVNLATSPSILAAFMIAAGNTAAAVGPALLIRHFCGNYPFGRTRDLLIFLGVGAVCSPALSALAGTTTLSLVVIGNFAKFVEIWQGWFLGDLVGALVVGPLVMRLLKWRISRRPLNQYGELVIICLATIVISSTVQTTPLISRPEFLFIFVSLPCVIWGAIRFGLLGAVLINALIVANIIVFAALGNKTFGAAGINTGLRDLYGYVIAISVGTLFLAGGMERIAIVTTRARDGRLSDEVHRMRRTLSIVIGIIGFGVSGLAAWYTYSQLDAANRVSTEQYRLAFEASLREELGRATDALVAVKTLFDVHGSVSANTFDAMIAPWVSRRPGVAALEWAPFIERRARALIEENAPLRGVENFVIRELVDGKFRTAAQRDSYFPVFYVFPRSGNEAAVGFDLSSEPTRRRALETALHTGNVTLTEPIKLVQSNSAVVTSLAYLGVENRRNPGGPPLGVAVGVLRLTDMISRAARVARVPLDFEIHLADLKSENADKLIYSNRIASYAIEHIKSEMASPFNPNVSNFTFGYRDWTIVLHPSHAGFASLNYWQPWAIFVFGSMVSTLLLIYLRSLNRTEKYVVELVAKRTKELENASEAAERAMNQAQQADRAKSEFIAHMSHEFRSPMTSILGYTQLASDSLDKDFSVETLRSYLSTIRSAGRHVLSLIGDVLDISKIEAGRLILEEVPFDLHQICEEVTSMMLVPARAQDNQLHFEIPQDMPRWVVGDPVRFKQVLTNLVSNAIKFTKFGNVNVSATPISVTDDNMAFRISVRDEGIGIPKDKLETIFEAFAQVDTSISRRYGGTGLGLAICQRMVQTMGGLIQVESIPGKGSTFWFELTLPRSSEQAATELNQADASDMAEDRQDKERVVGWNLLLVEDIEINRILAQKLLEQQGHTITPAANGQDALDILSAQDFDAVLMDVHMPVLDGIEATRQIRALDDPIKATMPVLALTADISNDNLAAFKDAGFDAHCTKPLDIRAINNELSKLNARMLSARLEALSKTGG